MRHGKICFPLYAIDIHCIKCLHFILRYVLVTVNVCTWVMLVIGCIWVFQDIVILMFLGESIA